MTSQPHRPVLKQARNTNIPLTLNFAEPSILDDGDPKSPLAPQLPLCYMAIFSSAAYRSEEMASQLMRDEGDTI